MSNIYDGGPAFPTSPTLSVHDGDDTIEHYGQANGLSARDYMATHILSGMIASVPPAADTMQNFALQAYAMADALLAVRDQNNLIEGTCDNV